MSTVETLDESLARFFSCAGACTTRNQCDAFANKTFGGPIIPIASQGLFSYSVSAADGTVLVQFRDATSPIDTQMLDMVFMIHADFVTRCKYWGTIGSSPGLLIYSMEMIPGESYFSISLSLLEENLDHQLATVRSLARFFAQSWGSGRSSKLSMDPTVLQDCHSSFNHLIKSLPEKFHKIVNHVQLHIPELFYGKYPLVITHGDLNKMNILIDPETGEITGIVDWAEAGVLPFGFALYALDHLLGYMTPDRWIPHDNAKTLEVEFWKSFCAMAGGVSLSEMKLIKVARTAGLLLRYGVAYQPGRKGVVGVGGSDALKLLEALITACSLTEMPDDAHADTGAIEKAT
ncbi:hypothetical protein TrVFT333_010425 [Trichoderma virens FT-333]|nr:hypothetical protein TrVFT333_010425 [Trichoderma virens FT-333]